MAIWKEILGKVYVEFFNLTYKHKKFYEVLTIKILANFRDFGILA